MEAANEEKKVLLDVKNLVKYYPVRAGVFQRVVAQVQAVDDISFHIFEGESFGLVGESGCGKSTVGRTLLKLQPQTGGEVFFQGKDVFKLNNTELKKTRSDMQIIFQDPFASLNPRMTIGESIGEGLRVHTNLDPQQRLDFAIDMLERVGLRGDHTTRYPHEFSGGQRQRIGIARALAVDPKFIVCDEPVSALDVSIQAQVLKILKELQDEFQLTYLFIAHNLSVVEHFCDRIAVMYLGKIVEMAPRNKLFSNPMHPYTQALMSAIPVPDPTRKPNRIILEGDVPSPLNPPSGCRFHTRCPLAFDRCRTEEPVFKDFNNDGHFAACHLIDPENPDASKLTREKADAARLMRASGSG